MAQTTVAAEPKLFTGGDVSSRQRSVWGMALQRLIRNKLAICGMVVIVILAAAALLQPWIGRYDPYTYQNYDALNQGPSKEHLFGTDNLGRDNFSRVLTGIRLSLEVGLGVAAAVLVVGALVGGLAAVGGGFWDNVLMRFTDIMYSFPDLLLIILIQAVFTDRKFPPPVLQVIFAISLVAWVTVARLIRGQMLSLRERDYVVA